MGEDGHTKHVVQVGSAGGKLYAGMETSSFTSYVVIGPTVRMLKVWRGLMGVGRFNIGNEEEEREVAPKYSPTNVP